jgi:hypothetical protein
LGELFGREQRIVRHAETRSPGKMVKVSMS